MGQDPRDPPRRRIFRTREIHPRSRETASRPAVWRSLLEGNGQGGPLSFKGMCVMTATPKMASHTLGQKAEHQPSKPGGKGR